MKIWTNFLIILAYVIIQFGFLNSCSQKKKSEQKEPGLLFSYGVIADCQYSRYEDSGNRRYSLSGQKLKQAVIHFNKMDLEFVVQLGDFIDKDFTSYDTVLPILQQLNVDIFHVLGNHDFSVPDTLKDSVMKKLNLRSRYYDFAVKKYRFIVLDGNDISFHAYPKESDAYQETLLYYQQNKIDSPEWNGALGQQQLIWLRSVLNKACQSDEKVILFCHFPVYPENIHNLWNALEVMKVIESYPCVKAFMSGHNHQGNYGFKAGIHYLTFKGMVETEQTAYAEIMVYADSLKVIGFGREQDRVLTLNK